MFSSLAFNNLSSISPSFPVILSLSFSSSTFYVPSNIHIKVHQNLLSIAINHKTASIKMWDRGKIQFRDKFSKNFLSPHFAVVILESRQIITTCLRCPIKKWQKESKKLKFMVIFGSHLKCNFVFQTDFNSASKILSTLRVA